MWNSKIFRLFLVLILNVPFLSIKAQFVEYDSIEVLNPKSKIDLRLKPYLTVLMP